MEQAKLGRREEIERLLGEIRSHRASAMPMSTPRS